MANFRLHASVLLATLLLHSTGTAHSPVEFLEVLSVKPVRTVEHTVELKSEFESERVKTDLKGPLHFSRSVGCMGRPAKKRPAYLNWFKIKNPSKGAPRQLDVLDMVRGSERKTLSIQRDEYLLSPSQLITSGVPDPVPGGLDLYKAYRIINASPINRDVTLAGSLGPEKRQLGKPLFVCLPVHQWHHDEHIPASHPRDCFVVYELDEHPHEHKFSTLDQFALNELQSTQSQWLCVRGAILRTRSD